MVPSTRVPPGRIPSKDELAHLRLRFTWRSPQYNGLLGACHYVEVPFVFDLLDSRGSTS
ncbi:hypothetical protein ABT337_09105 [Saccharopolyspora hirsuta]|uniref:hypothetical protein n=1 Tax=Saccharopolyspora hirsuta TaxID=1837 RepID=UPI00189454B2|nr:hypothetical protein [Nocardia farcinica]